MKKGLLAGCMLWAAGVMAQTGTVKGKITTTDGKPAGEVNIILKQINRAAIAAADGSYMLRNIKAGSYTINVSHMGLQTIEKNIIVTADAVLDINFSLKETAKQLDEVIVEARRTANEKAVTIGKVPIAAMDLPQAITVVNKSLMDNQQAQRLSDVLRNVNGVYLATTRGATSESFSARGYGLSSNNIFKDGIRINSGTFPETGSLERVEVLKGSAAILFGNVAAGGVVNMVTKQPKFTYGGEVAVRGGSFGLFKPSLDVYGPISNTIAFRVNGNFETSDSYRDVVHSKRYYVNPSFFLNWVRKQNC
jgi:iron complex outermembrane receptor protein